MPIEIQRYTVRIADWPDDELEIRRIRETVFVQEQGVPLELEWDGKDPQYGHILAVASDGSAVGTGRLSPSGHIGRMAVLAGHRRRGIGSALLERLLELAQKRGLSSVYLNAQTEAVSFYVHHGFQTEGEIFMDAGIPHIRMLRDVSLSRE